MSGNWWHARDRCCAGETISARSERSGPARGRDPDGGRCFRLARSASNSRTEAISACHSASITIASGRYSNCSDEIVRLRTEVRTQSAAGRRKRRAARRFAAGPQLHLQKRQVRIRPAIDQVGGLFCFQHWTRRGRRARASGQGNRQKVRAAAPSFSRR